MEFSAYMIGLAIGLVLGFAGGFQISIEYHGVHEYDLMLEIAKAL